MTDLAAEALDRDAVYQRGFDHGRRWAAEEVLRIAAEEIRLQSSWLWHALGEERLTEVAARFGRRLIREMEHPAAPSEPVPDGPRVWAMPDNVRKLSDRFGVVWQWAGGPYFTSGEDDGDEETIETLMTRRGPLTEVIDP